MCSSCPAGLELKLNMSLDRVDRWNLLAMHKRVCPEPSTFNTCSLCGRTCGDERKLLDHLKKFQHCCAQEQGTRSAPPTKPRQTTTNNGLSAPGQQQQLPPQTAKRESFLVEQQIRPVSQNQTVQIGTISHDPQSIKFESNPVTVQTSLAQAIHQLQPQTIIGQQQQMQNQNFQNVASYSFPLTGTESLSQMSDSVQNNQFQQNPTSTVTTTSNPTLSSLVLPGLLNLLHEQENSNETENNK